MVYCIQCGNQLPDGAKFCYKCGAAIPAGASGAGGTGPTPSAPSAPTLAPPGAQELKCPACGAPVHPAFGEAVVTCDYCGSSVTLGGAGWKEISKHSMLPLKLADPAQALEAVRAAMDTGFLHRKDFQESKVTGQKLTMVPYWVIPATASTNYQYQDAAVGIGSTVAAVGASALLGSALSGGNRGGMIMMPMFAGPAVNPTRQDTITGNYEFPVVAVKALANYQPKSYQFPLAERTLFDKKQVPAGTPVLNGDLTEDAARNSARAYVTQLQSNEAHKKHHMVSNFKTEVDVSEGELLHAPIWEFVLERKGETERFLVDAHAGRVLA